MLNEEKNNEKKTVTRRDILKGFATIPVLGLFTYDYWKSRALKKAKDKALQLNLGISDSPSVQPKLKISNSESVIRIGMVGMGIRSQQLLKALGFVDKNWFDVQSKMMNENDEGAKRRLETYFNQDILNVRVTAICDAFDLHAERGREIASNGIQPNGESVSFKNVKRFKTFSEMVASNDIDAVIISTPDFQHADMVIEAVKNGKHVYCEKALTLTEDELHKVYKAVKESNVVFQLGNQNSKNETFKKAKEIIDKGILGKVTLIETTTNRNTKAGAWIRHLDSEGNLKPGSPETINWKQWLGKTKKIPFDLEVFYGWARWFRYDTGLSGQLFSHEIDAVNQIMGFGIPKSVTSSGGIYFHKEPRDMPDTFHSILEFPDREFSLTYSASLANSNFRGRVFMGNDATMEVGSNLKVIANADSPQYASKIENGIIDPQNPIFIFPKEKDKIDGLTSASEKYYAQRGLIDTSVAGKNYDVTYLHVKDWIDVIRNGGKTGCDIEKAFQNTVSVLMVHKSYLKQRKVEWDPINKRIV